jgi:hypothetical protein
MVLPLKTRAVAEALGTGLLVCTARVTTSDALIVLRSRGRTSLGWRRGLPNRLRG